MKTHLVRALGLALAIAVAVPVAQAQLSGGAAPAAPGAETAPAVSPPGIEGSEMMRERRREVRDRRRAMREHRREASEDRGRGRAAAHRRPGRADGAHRGMHPAAMRMVFLLIDTDGNGTLSLAEVNAVTTRLFNASDGNADGELSVEELRAFSRALRSRGWSPNAAIEDTGDAGMDDSGGDMDDEDEDDLE